MWFGLTTERLIRTRSRTATEHSFVVGQPVRRVYPTAFGVRAWTALNVPVDSLCVCVCCATCDESAGKTSIQ